MLNCSVCGVKLGLFSKKHRIDEAIYCHYCHESYWEEQKRKEEAKRQIIEEEKLREEARIGKEKEKSAFEIYKTISKIIEDEAHNTIVAMKQNDTDIFAYLFFGSFKFNSSKDINALLNNFETFLSLGKNHRGPTEMIKVATEFKKMLFESITFFNDDESIKAKRDVWRMLIRRGYFLLSMVSIPFIQFSKENFIIIYRRNNCSL